MYRVLVLHRTAKNNNQQLAIQYRYNIALLLTRVYVTCTEDGRRRTTDCIWADGSDRMRERNRRRRTGACVRASVCVRAYECACVPAAVVVAAAAAIRCSVLGARCPVLAVLGAAAATRASSLKRTTSAHSPTPSPSTCCSSLFSSSSSAAKNRTRSSSSRPFHQNTIQRRNVTLVTLSRAILVAGIPCDDRRSGAADLSRKFRYGDDVREQRRRRCSNIGTCSLAYRCSVTPTMAQLAGRRKNTNTSTSPPLF